MVPFQSLCTIFYLHSIATMAVCVTVSTQYTNVTANHPVIQTDSWPISGFQVDQQFRRRPSRISESCLSQPVWTTTPKRTEHNLTVVNLKPK